MALGIVVVAVLAVPLIVALVALRDHHWFPLLDMAQTEMRVRDVASSHPPLTGLAGRIGTFGRQGSHPGPLSFWALWPFYQAFGSGSWALEAAAVVLNLVAIALALWLAYRRGGTPLLLAMGAVLAVLTRAYGATLLTQPWNPYLPMMWWFAFLLAVWSVLCDDLPALPVVVFTGSYCMQTHVSYLGLIGGMAVVALAYTAWRARQQWSDRRARQRFVRWSAAALALGAFLWLPPVIDQLTESGNLHVLWEYFTNPPEAAIGPAEGLRVLLVNLNPWRLVSTGVTFETGTSGSVVPGILLLGAWLGAAVIVWRRRGAQAEARPLARLHVTLAFALGFALVSASRIFGFVWYYLTLWAWGLAALMLFAIGWTAAVEARRRWSDASTRFARVGSAALVAVTVVSATVFSIEASSVDVPTPKLNDALGAVVEPTARAVAKLPDRDAPYLLTWLPDPIGIGAQGYGLLNELDRRGLDVRAEDVHINGATPHRIIKRVDAKVEIHLAVGPEIEKWRDEPGFTEVAFSEPRTRRERNQFERLRTRVIEDLIAAGLSERVPLVDGNIFVLTFDTRVPESTRRRIGRMIDLGLPAAVFIGLPTATS